MHMTSTMGKHTFLNFDIFIINTIFMNPSCTRTHYSLSPCACVIGKASKTDTASVRINLIINIISWPLCNWLQLTYRLTFHCTSCSIIWCTGGIITHRIIWYKLWSKCGAVNMRYTTYFIVRAWFPCRFLCCGHLVCFSKLPKCCLLCPLLLLTLHLLFLQLFFHHSLLLPLLFSSIFFLFFTCSAFRHSALVRTHALRVIIEMFKESAH